MWMFPFLYTVYFTVISAHELCPDACECQGKNIKCAGQKLLQIPKWLPKDVTNLDLSGNRLSFIANNTFLEFSNLYELNLSDNEITNVRNLGGFPKSLKVLHLKGNKLKSLNGNWSQFIKLDFSQNAIDFIGNESLKGIKDLEELKLGGNNLTEVPEIDCDSLKTLDLSNNKLRTIKTLTFYYMVPNIEYLKLSNNRIKTLPTAAFSKLDLLKHLYLDGNWLETITYEWMFGMTSLEYLHLENNKIVNISSSSWMAEICCKKLRHINLEHNNLKRIGNDRNNGGNFMNLNSLNTLNLASNEIFYISDDAFKDLKNLRILDLSNNKISLVENSTFGKLRSLEKLDMRSNPIAEVTTDAFSALKNLQSLKMNSDVLDCSCKLKWFSKWLKTRRFSSSVVSLKCSKPKNLQGQDFTTVSLKSLVCDLSRPQITSHPKSQIAMTGEKVRLSCTVKNGSIQGLRILWQKNMKNIDMNEANVMVYTQMHDTYVIYQSNLVLNHVTVGKDSGDYRCIVLMGKERIQSRIASLRVFVFPRFTSTPGDLVTTIGEDVRINCSASGHPQPEISLKVPVAVVDEGRVTVDGSSFIIKNISQGDIGLHYCFAESEAGKINTTFTLNVIGKPVAEQEMLDKIVLVNDAAVFVCAANAWPRPEYVWLKDGKMLDLTSSNLQIIKKQNAQHLIVLHAEYSDAGRYKCRVSNPLGSIELSSRLKVVKDLPGTPHSPDDESVSNKTLIGAVIFTAACTMVLTTLICVAVLHALARRGCNCLTRHKTPGTVTLDSYAATDPENQAYVEMTEAFPNESPRSSSTFVTSSDSRAHSDVQTSSSESGSTKEHRESSYDGRHSSGVCSMNSSNSSLSSAVNHRNTFPFSNAKNYPYPGPEEELYYVSNTSNDVSCTHGQPTSRQSLQHKPSEQYHPGRRRHRSGSRDKSSRSRERNVNKRRKGVEQERLHKPSDETGTTDEYRTESVTESEGTVL